MHLQLIFTYCLILNIFPVKSTCPESKGLMKRVGNTKYFIFQTSTRPESQVNFEGAKKQCEYYKLKMATVKDMLTLAVLGRQLEKIVHNKKFKDTWYWLDAAWNSEEEKYYWENKEEVKYSPFYYRPPRPIGVSSHISYYGNYNLTENKTQCITLALPRPGSADHNNKTKVFEGHQLSFDEKDCSSKQKRHSICESDSSSCVTNSINPFELAEDKHDYFYSGNWIFGDRKYILNWEQRNFNQSQKYCEDLGMSLMSPGEDEGMLIPHIKMWSRGITSSLFWTSLSFKFDEKHFVNSSGIVVAKHPWGASFNEFGKHKNLIKSPGVRSHKYSPSFCVAISLAYEFKEQMPCSNPWSTNCTWSFIHYAPANCKNYHGTICQHKDHATRGIQWYENFKNNMQTVLRETAVTKEFGHPNNTIVVRSKYKQTFGTCYCPKGYLMLRENGTWLLSKPSSLTTEHFAYDYQETYWVVDKERFNKTLDSTCTVITLEGKTWKHKKVSCTEWHFYLCEKISIPLRKTKDVFNPAPSYYWRECPQPRRYPLLRTDPDECRISDSNSCECLFPLSLPSGISQKCAYNTVTNQCVQRQPQCSWDTSCWTECRRGGDHVFYAIGGEVCNSKETSGDCEIAHTVFAVNFNSGNHTDSRNINYAADDKSMFEDPHNLYEVLPAQKKIDKIPARDANLYQGSLSIIGKGPKYPEQCISFKIPNHGDGQYEISFKTGENYQSNGKHFGFRLNGQYIVKTFTPELYREKYEGMELNVNFRILDIGRTLEIKGHPLTKIEGDLKVDMCSGDCTHREKHDHDANVCAISVVKFKNM